MAPPPTSSEIHRPPPPPPPAPPSSHSVPMLLPVFIIFFILMCFLSVFLFRDLLYYLSTSAWLASRRSRHPSGGPHHAGNNDSSFPPGGLDPAILASFPTLPYEAVRGIQEGKCGGECAVCLGDFAAGDVIRLLTVCCHAFHPACIDSWLGSHTTCPVCRSDLEAPPDEAAVMAVRKAVGEGGSVVIDVAEEGDVAKPPPLDRAEEGGCRVSSAGSAEERTESGRTGTGST